jgi:hypothetical protein
MKVGQKSIVRWISQRVGKRSEPTMHKEALSHLRELEAVELRQVSGGTGSPSLPKVGW